MFQPAVAVDHASLTRVSVFNQQLNSVVAPVSASPVDRGSNKPRKSPQKAVGKVTGLSLSETMDMAKGEHEDDVMSNT